MTTSCMFLIIIWQNAYVSNPPVTGQKGNKVAKKLISRTKFWVDPQILVFDPQVMISGLQNLVFEFIPDSGKTKLVDLMTKPINSEKFKTQKYSKVLSFSF